VAQNHGYIFEVPVNTTPGNPVWQPQPIRQMGRFAHEVSAVDPETGVVYLTEDNGDTSGLYRFVPTTKPTAPGQLGTTIGGTLQMMKVANTNQYTTAIGQTVGAPLAASWVTIANPDAGSSMTAVFNQGFAAGGARFRRLEGAWFGRGKLYFASTNGGDAGLGQIWVHDPIAETVTLIFESDNVDVMDACDNITVTPRGGLIVCEDNGGMQFLRGISPNGEIFDFAKNIFNGIEFAGAVFSPDGQTLFVNLFGRLTTRTLTPYAPGPVTGPSQTPVMGEISEQALTLAIWGPWRSGLL
jgi:secreted PhoX family phosphatase